MENRDFVIISLNPWYTPLSSTSKSVAKELAKKNRVLYVNPPLDRRTVLLGRREPMLQHHLDVVQGRQDSLVEIDHNLWNFYPKQILESVNWLPSTTLFSLFNRLNNKRFAKSILSGLNRLNFKDYILINDKDLFRGFYLKEMLRPDIYLYYDRDYILGVDYWKKHGLALEPRLAAKSDLIVTHSDHFKSLLEPFNPNIYNVGSGIDISIFDGYKTYRVPTELEGISKPILGYVGALTTLRLDIKSLIQIARTRPDWHLALVGPEDDDFRSSVLHELPNVTFVGRKPLLDVPAYIANFDVCLNLQVINEVTIGNYPLKIDEYLAMGKAVVATRTKGMKLFESYTYLVNPGEPCIPFIEKAIHSDNEAEKHIRISFARSHSWENILNNIYEAIENTTLLQNGHHLKYQKSPHY